MAMWNPMRRLSTERAARPAAAAMADVVRAPVPAWLVVALVCLAAQAAPVRAAATAAPAPAQQAQPPGRGQLLYETHCVACHTTQMHWRDNRRVQDWAGLLAQVRQWQARAQLNWNDDDVQDVARHLNERIYRLPAPERRAAVTGPAGR